MDSDTETLSDTPVECEDLYVSDSEGAADSEFKSIPLSIDYGSRIVSADKSSEPASDSSFGRLLYDRESNYSVYQALNRDEGGDTSCDECELSDEETPCLNPLNLLQKINIDGSSSVGSKDHTNSASSFNDSSVVFMSSLRKGKPKKLFGGLALSGLPSSFKNAFAETRDKLSSVHLSNSFSGEMLVEGRDMSQSDKSHLLTCWEFLKSDVSDEGETTDVEEVSLDLADDKESPSFPPRNLSDVPSRSNCQNLSVLDAVLRNRGRKDPADSGRRPSWTVEVITDDGAISDDDDSDKKTLYKRNCKRLSDAGQCLNECLTDEEVMDFDNKEWTETDESGGVRQVTRIKTETSIKLEGDETGLDHDRLVSTTTTTRVVTSLTSDSDDVEDIRQSCQVSYSETTDSDRPRDLDLNE